MKIYFKNKYWDLITDPLLSCIRIQIRVALHPFDDLDIMRAQLGGDDCHVFLQVSPGVFNVYPHSIERSWG